MDTKTNSARLEPKQLVGQGIFLRGIRLEDVNERYLSWMTDTEINQFMESRFQSHTLDSIRSFVADKIDKSDRGMFAIVTRETETHIGNIKISNICWEHGRADFGIMIGDKAHTGKGYATQAIQLLKDYAFKELNLRKITAGCYITNKASIRAFEKAGFHIEATIKRHSIYKGQFIDCVLLAAFA